MFKKILSIFSMLAIVLGMSILSITNPVVSTAAVTDTCPKVTIVPIISPAPYPSNSGYANQSACTSTGVDNPNDVASFNITHSISQNAAVEYRAVQVRLEPQGGKMPSDYFAFDSVTEEYITEANPTPVLTGQVPASSFSTLPDGTVIILFAAGGSLATGSNVCTPTNGFNTTNGDCGTEPTAYGKMNGLYHGTTTFNLKLKPTAPAGAYSFTTNTSGMLGNGVWIAGSAGSLTNDFSVKRQWTISGTVPVSPCTNGANNPPSCNVCPVGTYLVGAPLACQAFPVTVNTLADTTNTTPAITGTCFATANISVSIAGQTLTTTCTGAGTYSVTPTALNYATHPIVTTQTFGSTAPIPTVTANGSIRVYIPDCTNGANNPPSCNVCPTGQAFLTVGSNCVSFPLTINAISANNTDTTPDISGSCLAGASLTILVGTGAGAQTLTTTCLAGGTYLVTPLTELPLGVNQVQVTQTSGIATSSVSGTAPVVLPICTNGANNFPSCNTCPTNMIMDTVCKPNTPVNNVIKTVGGLVRTGGTMTITLAILGVFSTLLAASFIYAKKTGRLGQSR